MLIPQKEKVKQKVPWENEIIIEKRKQLKKLSQMKNRNARANVRKHKQAQKDLEATYFNEQQNTSKPKQTESKMHLKTNSLH